jgi:hypothetical protein
MSVARILSKGRLYMCVGSSRVKLNAELRVPCVAATGTQPQERGHRHDGLAEQEQVLSAPFLNRSLTCTGAVVATAASNGLYIAIDLGSARSLHQKEGPDKPNVWRRSIMMYGTGTGTLTMVADLLV